jgi:hypothetical protein
MIRKLILASAAAALAATIAILGRGLAPELARYLRIRRM